MADDEKKNLTPEELEFMRIGTEIVQAFEVFMISIPAIDPGFDALSMENKIRVVTSAVLASIMTLNVKAGTATQMVRTMTNMLGSFAAAACDGNCESCAGHGGSTPPTSTNLN